MVVAVVVAVAVVVEEVVEVIAHLALKCHEVDRNSHRYLTSAVIVVKKKMALHAVVTKMFLHSTNALPFLLVIGNGFEVCQHGVCRSVSSSSIHLFFCCDQSREKQIHE